jgi:hypothetical protein
MVTQTGYMTTGATEDWMAQASSLGIPTKKKKKRKTANATGAPPTRSADSGAGRAMPPMGSTNVAPAPRQQSGQAQRATEPAVFKAATDAGTMTAPAGSLASLPTGGPGLDMFADSPGAMADLYYGNRNGLGAGSMSGQLATQYANPQFLQYGLLGSDQLPGNNIDMINFGEQLFQSAAMNAPGTQFSPGFLMSNVLKAVTQEASRIATKGAMDENSGGLLGMMVTNTDQMGALQDFLSLIRGLLSGAMPDSSLQSYLNYIQKLGQEFMQQWGTSPDRAAMEGQGRGNVVSYVAQKLMAAGPNAGLG